MPQLNFHRWVGRAAGGDHGGAVYFTSDESRWTTGSIMAVDGGVMAT
jgi:hypothetical protein